MPESSAHIQSNKQACSWRLSEQRKYREYGEQHHFQQWAPCGGGSTTGAGRRGFPSAPDFCGPSAVIMRDHSDFLIRAIVGSTQIPDPFWKCARLVFTPRVHTKPNPVKSMVSPNPMYPELILTQRHGLSKNNSRISTHIQYILPSIRSIIHRHTFALDSQHPRPHLYPIFHSPRILRNAVPQPF